MFGPLLGFALIGLIGRRRVPRALPWADIGRPFGAKTWPLVSDGSENPGSSSQGVGLGPHRMPLRGENMAVVSDGLENPGSTVGSHKAPEHRRGELIPA